MSFLASTRARRSNAGANMSKLLDQEEELNEDDFYKTHYGGFEDIVNDSDFDNANSSDSENVIDSDFDIDETADQPAPEDEEAVEKALKVEERESKQKRSVYKDPKARGSGAGGPSRKKVLTKKRSTPPTASKEPTSTSSSSASTPTHSTSYGGPPAKKFAGAASTSKATFKSDVSDGISDGDYEYPGGSSGLSRSLRKSTQKHTAAIRDLVEERKREKKKKPVKKSDYRPLTQKELLKEAQKTERENTKWLANYKLIEVERLNKAKAAKARKNVPVIRYHSYIDTEEVEEKEDGDNDKDGEEKQDDKNKKSTTTTRSVCRTVITFPSEESLRRHFPSYKTKEEAKLESLVVNAPKTTAGQQKKAAADQQTTTSSTTAPAVIEKQDPLKETSSDANSKEAEPTSEQPVSLLSSVKLPREKEVACVITGRRPAKYFDPLTQQPYFDAGAFKLLRYYYGLYLREQFPSMKDSPAMAEFLRQNTDSARQMTVSAPKTTTIKINLSAAAKKKVAVVGGGGVGRKAQSTSAVQTGVSSHLTTTLLQQQLPQGAVQLRPFSGQPIQLQYLTTNQSTAGGSRPAGSSLLSNAVVMPVTLTTDGSVGGQVSTTPLNIINSSGAGGSSLFILSMTNARGNPIIIRTQNSQAVNPQTTVSQQKK